MRNAEGKELSHGAHGEHGEKKEGKKPFHEQRFAPVLVYGCFAAEDNGKRETDTVKCLPVHMVHMVHMVHQSTKSTKQKKGQAKKFKKIFFSSNRLNIFFATATIQKKM